MNKTIIFFFILILFIISCSKDEPPKSEGFIIDITYPTDISKKIYLLRHHYDNIDTIQTAKLNNGHARFAGKLKTPELLYVYVDKQKSYIPVFVENSQINIKVTTIEPQRYKITGSKINKEFENFIEDFSVYRKKQQHLVKLRRSTRFMDDTTIVKQFDSISDGINNEIKLFLMQYVKNNNNSFVSVYIIYRYFIDRLTIENLKNLTKNLDKSVCKGYYYDFIMENIEIKSEKKLQNNNQGS